MSAPDQDLHRNQPLSTGGTPLDEATAAMILLHGRGASAQGILSLADEFAASDVAYLAPQAARRAWYPASFLASRTENEPALTSALNRVGELVADVQEAGIPAERILLLGFSQGGCLAAEYAVQNPQRYGGVIALSGALIGPEGAIDMDPAAYTGTLDGTPVFLGCSDQDPYIPLERVEETADLLRSLGGEVTKRIYEGMGHTTNGDEIKHVRAILDRYVSLRPSGSDEEGEEEDDESREGVVEESVDDRRAIDELDDDVDFLRNE
jgi:phospholipase/carboxylesterase